MPKSRKPQETARHVSRCAICRPTPLHPWVWPTRAWQRVHVDFAKKDKQMYLVLIDSHSKWIEVFPVTSTTSTKTTECLRPCFVTYGVPEQLVSDNGPQFTSD